MNSSCKNINAFGTHTAFPASPRSTPGPVSLGIPEPGSFASSAGEKNSLRCLWPPSSHLLRPEDPQIRDLPCADQRIYLEVEIRRVSCRRCGKVKQERLDWLADYPFCTKRFAFYVGRRCRDSTYSGCGQRVSPGLADGQGLGDAVYAGDAPASRDPGAESYWFG